MERDARLLIALGALLFLLGLVSGLVVPLVSNPRMGLSGHLEGVMNGTFLIAIGAVWTRLVLGPRQLAWTRALLIYGTFANWGFIGLASVFGTSDSTPIAGAGHVGAPWQETIVTGGLVSVALAMLIACALLVVGFFNARRSESLA